MDVAELVTRSRQGDVEAFTELVRRYQSMVFGYARATISDTHLAEDATQQAFLLAYQNIGSLRDPDRFGGWLRGIVRFECLRVIRAVRRYPTITPLDERFRDPGDGPQDLTESDDSLSRTIAALDVLPEHERVVAFLFYIHDQSQREVAEFLGLPISTINNRLRSARKHLREGVLSEMANNPINTGQQHDFAKGVGEVLKAQGAIVDVTFGMSIDPNF